MLFPLERQEEAGASSTLLTRPLPLRNPRIHADCCGGITPTGKARCARRLWPLPLPGRYGGLVAFLANFRPVGAPVALDHPEYGSENCGRADALPCFQRSRANRLRGCLASNSGWSSAASRHSTGGASPPCGSVAGATSTGRRTTSRPTRAGWRSQMGGMLSFPADPSAPPRHRASGLGAGAPSPAAARRLRDRTAQPLPCPTGTLVSPLLRTGQRSWRRLPRFRTFTSRPRAGWRSRLRLVAALNPLRSP